MGQEGYILKRYTAPLRMVVGIKRKRAAILKVGMGRSTEQLHVLNSSSDVTTWQTSFLRFSFSSGFWYQGFFHHTDFTTKRSVTVKDKLQKHGHMSGKSNESLLILYSHKYKSVDFLSLR